MKLGGSFSVVASTDARSVERLKLEVRYSTFSNDPCLLEEKCFTAILGGTTRDRFDVTGSGKQFHDDIANEFQIKALVTDGRNTELINGSKLLWIEFGRHHNDGNLPLIAHLTDVSN